MNRRTLLGAAAALPKALRGAATPAATVAWETGSALPVKRSEFGAARLAGSIVVAGGFDAGTEVDALDPELVVWRRFAEAPVNVDHAGVAALNGLLFLAGGYQNDGGAATAALHAYDPEADCWIARAPMLAAKGAFGFVAAEGAVFALGGALERLGGPAVGSVDRYDPARDAWETVSRLPTPREHLGAAISGGVIYTFGGRANGDESTTFAAAAEAFDIRAGTWRTLPPLPAPRAGLGAAAFGGGVIAAGGERGELVFSAVERFDIGSGTWSPLPSLKRARHGLGLAATASGVLFALGGSVRGGQVESVAVVETLDLSEIPAASR